MNGAKPAAGVGILLSKLAAHIPLPYPRGNLTLPVPKVIAPIPFR